MRRLLPLLLLAPAVATQDAPVQVAAERGMRVELAFDDEGAPLLTIRARDVSAEALTRLVARRLRIPDVVGFDGIDRDPRVSAYLVERPPRDALRWILGSVGVAVRIGSDAIVVEEDVGPHPDPSALLRKAGTRYFDALRRFPDYPLADRAMMARAEIHERLGPEEWGPAVLAYERLIEAHPDSPLVPEALLRAARLNGRLGRWRMAALRFEELAALQIDHPYHAVARLELAEALCRVGEGESEPAAAADAGEKATYVLDALDASYPTQVPEERFERLLVRARAHALSGDGLAALKSLDAAQRYSHAGDRDPRVLELRARALERTGELGAAATAWLAYGEELTGEAREDAYVAGARVALAAGEELAVLMIERRARAEGFGDKLAAAAAEARARLGLVAETAAVLDPAAELARGEAHVAARRWSAAIAVLRPLLGRLDELDGEQRLRLGQALAPALQRAGEERAAIDALRAIVARLDKESRRRALYVLAARLYEERDPPRLDLAIEALKGRL